MLNDLCHTYVYYVRTILSGTGPPIQAELMFNYCKYLQYTLRFNSNNSSIMQSLHVTNLHCILARRKPPVDVISVKRSLSLDLKYVSYNKYSE